ncbi:MAG: DUF2723 domain-containing protein [Myxococcales bacterium]|nr:DUF2723 domain-containing protein [Myxococcales bacterium]
MTDDPDRLLALPVPSRRHTALSATALFIFYVSTMSRSLSLYDSPELALVAEQLGLGHPLGQPLHTLLGGLVARLPGVDPLIALNGLSALAGALTVIPATSLAGTLLRANAGAREGDWRWIAPAIAIVGMLPVLWEPSTRIEVYPLAFFCGLWGAARLTSAWVDSKRGALAYLSTGVALGLSASANAVCAFGIAVALFPSLTAATLQRTTSPRELGALIGGGILGLTPYSYVFAVARREDVVVWGAPTNAASIRHYFTAADFTPKQVGSFLEWWEHVGELFFWSLHNGLLALMLVGLVGFVSFRRPMLLGASFLGITLAFFVSFVARNGVFATDVLDYLGYLAIPTWIAATGVGLFVAHLAGRRLLWGAAAIGLVVLFVMVTTPRPLGRTRHLDTYSEALAYQALRAAPRNAVLILEQDHWIGPMWYLQERLDVRGDVVVVAYGLSASEWYWRYLYRRHPTLHDFELRAKGGRAARVQRFVKANGDRPVQVERIALANALGLSTCPSDWLLDVTRTCNPVTSAPLLATYTAAELYRLGQGSPGTDGLIALVTLDRGYDLWTHGLPRAAVEVLLAGVPAIEGLERVDLSLLPARVDPQARPSPLYEPHVALGHPARNLHYAAVIARASRLPKLADYLERLSDALGPVEPKFASLTRSPANL